MSKCAKSSATMQQSPVRFPVLVQEHLKFANYKSKDLGPCHRPFLLSMPIASLPSPCQESVERSTVKPGFNGERPIVGEHHVGTSCSINEMVNACYAKLWQGSVSSRHLDEEDDRHDNGVSNSTSSSYGERDLKKLDKLRLKSKLRFRKCKEKGDVKQWVETSDKFLNLLKEIRQKENTENPTKDENNNAGANTENNTLAKSSESPLEAGNDGKVHFPQHVLLCGALQEGDPNEVRSIINNNNINLNSLSRATGYYYLHKTIANGQFSCAKILLDSGSEVDAKDSKGISSLALAFRVNRLDMAALLLDYGADLSQYTRSRVDELEKVKRLSCSVSKVFEMNV